MTVLRDDLTASLIKQGVPSAQARHLASSALSRGRGAGDTIPLFVRTDFANAMHTVLWVMATIMMAAGVVAVIGLRRGVQQPASEPVRAAAETAADPS